MAELDLLFRAFVNFREHRFPDPRAHGFRWVDLKSFRFAPDRPDAALLAALVAHEQFRDDYAGGGVEPEGLRHSPYWLHEVGPGAYLPVGRAEAARTLAEWAGDGLPDSLEAALDATLRTVVDSADRRYRLPDLGADAFHDWGGVHGEFHEYVAVDDDRRVLTLLVAADD
ncbi:hypothetical protein ACFY00_22420 [Kitasatospora sp. NPDC001540]|uniref:hypothetical protein n=1 Tax=Kitasatospora sp. NPDC001540 TaxID=3364014 RepID=UPI0036A67445